MGLSVNAQVPPDIGTIKTDLQVPKMEVANPAPGKRVKMVLFSGGPGVRGLRVRN
jgi:hypothetical protein